MASNATLLPFPVEEDVHYAFFQTCDLLWKIPYPLLTEAIGTIRDGTAQVCYPLFARPEI